MIKIGIAQIKNSIEIEENFSSIMKALIKFQSTDTDLILFPECSLSGFSAKIKECTLDLIKDHLLEIENWSNKFNKYVVLPTALVDGKIYNSGFIFGNGEIERFYKLGLTKSEQNFFSIPELPSKKVFRIKEYNIAILICFELQMEPWQFFKEGEADLILWPGYWGWEKDDTWNEFKKDSEPNLLYRNMEQWKLPLIQSNFAFNDLSDYRGAGPHGLSMFVDSNNTLFAHGEFESESCYQISVDGKKFKEYKKID